jgi:hypothetical protein
MTVNTEFLGSGLTQQFTGSDVSFAGGAVFRSTVSVIGTATLGAVTTGALTVGSTLGSASAISTGNARVLNLGIGNSTTSLTFVSGSSTTIVATTVAATMSTTTTKADNVVQLGDIILVGPSNLSNGVVLQAYASANSTITFNYSNVSTAAASNVAINCRYIVLRSNG